MSYVTTYSRGAHGGAYARLNVDGEHAPGTTYEEILRVDMAELSFLDLYAWADVDQIDIKLQYLLGYEDKGAGDQGDEVWQDEARHEWPIALAAASTENAPVASEIINIYRGPWAPRWMRVMAKTASADGELYLEGVAKAFGPTPGPPRVQKQPLDTETLSPSGAAAEITLPAAEHAAQMYWIAYAGPTADLQLVRASDKTKGLIIPSGVNDSYGPFSLLDTPFTHVYGTGSVDITVLVGE